MSDIAPHLDALAERFAARLPDEQAGLRAAQGNKEELIQRAHKLAGIAGMLGRADIGAAALAFEEKLRTGGDADSEFAELDALLDCHIPLKRST